MLTTAIVVPEIDEESQIDTGAFQAVHRPLNDGTLFECEVIIVHETLHWFDKNLAKPDRFTKSRPPTIETNSHASSERKRRLCKVR